MNYRNLKIAVTVIPLLFLTIDSAVAEEVTLPDYDALLKSCKNGCCESSVREMKAKHAFLQDGYKPCRAGYESHMYRCEGSLSWCEPGAKLPAKAADQSAPAEDAKPAGK